MSSFLQSKDWFDFQRSLGRPVFEYDRDGIKAGVIKLSLPFKKSYLYIPHGPEMDFNSMSRGFKNPVNNFVMWLKELANPPAGGRKAIFIKAEPFSDSVAQVLAEHKFKKSKKEIQPSKTVVVDLTKSENDLLDAMHHKTRYNIKVAEKNNITVTDSTDSDIFWDLMRKTAKRDKFSPHDKKYYQQLLRLNTGSIKTDLVLAFYNDRPVAGAIILLHGDTGYYLHGASDYEYRNMMAPYKLHWENIKYLKEQGYKYYDFWGINSKKWLGVTRFKLGWGGRVIEHPGSFDLRISSLWYIIYKLARKLNKWV